MENWSQSIQQMIDIIDRCIRQQEDEALTLRALSAAEGGIGRGQLCRLAEQEGLLLTDQTARDALQALNRLGLISVSRGRGGSRLTLRGRQLAEAFSK